MHRKLGNKTFLTTAVELDIFPINKIKIYKYKAYSCGMVWTYNFIQFISFAMPWILVSYRLYIVIYSEISIEISYSASPNIRKCFADWGY